LLLLQLLLFHPQIATIVLDGPIPIVFDNGTGSAKGEKARHRRSRCKGTLTIGINMWFGTLRGQLGIQCTPIEAAIRTPGGMGINIVVLWCATFDGIEWDVSAAMSDQRMIGLSRWSQEEQYQ
jgi:hypothetical protein